ncbi:putative methyltransferase-domain-containing protein [Rhexocercosporidium sp. MPI-PUGE-AT-0058]|nr:putative methyltransferase-domain-containing protein [Rhexocercosporidium sp. MPI-PUGE-AT-0058]
MDLPSLRQNPSYNSILKALESLQLKPSSWDETSVPEGTHPEGDVSANVFLISVIMSEFEWLQEMKDDAGVVLSVDDQKEKLITEASSRMSERCGRSAAGEMTRTWVIPKSLALPEIRFDIREPPLTGDQIGLKTWGTSYVLAKRLEFIGSEYLGPIINDATPSNHPKILELGAGTGLVGMAAAAVWKSRVLLTDLVDIQENMMFNINKNLSTVSDLGGRISGEVLDWTKAREALPSLRCKEFEIVIAADPMYDHEHPELVAKMVKMFLKEGTESRALVAIPLRDAHTKRLALHFATILENTGFCVVHQDHETFNDDWQSEEEVQVQWTIWRRTEGDLDFDGPSSF